VPDYVKIISCLQFLLNNVLAQDFYDERLHFQRIGDISGLALEKWVGHQQSKMFGCHELSRYDFQTYYLAIKNSTSPREQGEKSSREPAPCRVSPAPPQGTPCPQVRTGVSRGELAATF